MKEIKETVYIADDGTRFLDKEECEGYEAMVGKIKFFIVTHSPDLNETGLFTKEDVVAVYSEDGDHLAIVERWCVSEKGYQILGPSVQGVGFQRHFEIIEGKGGDNVNWPKERWNKYMKGASVTDGRTTWPQYDEKVFLSPIPVDGFPEPYNYMDKWFLKN